MGPFDKIIRHGSFYTLSEWIDTLWHNKNLTSTAPTWIQILKQYIFSSFYTKLWREEVNWLVFDFVEEQEVTGIKNRDSHKWAGFIITAGKIHRKLKVRW